MMSFFFLFFSFLRLNSQPLPSRLCLHLLLLLLCCPFFRDEGMWSTKLQILFPLQDICEFTYMVLLLLLLQQKIEAEC